MSRRRGSIAALVLLGGLAGAGGAAAAAAPTQALPLPTPETPVLLNGVGATADRLRTTNLPAGTTAADDEAVSVAVRPDGTPTKVSVDQRIRLRGRGDYVVVERGPARQAEVLGDGDPPTLKAGAVLYAGFLPPSGRELSARLLLDPAYEAARIPLQLSLTFQAEGSDRPAPLATPHVPGPGRLTLTLTSAAASVLPIATGDAPAAAVAGVLDRLRRAANPLGDRPPAAGAGLPVEVPGATGVSNSVEELSAPLQVSGSVRVLKGGQPLAAVGASGAGAATVPGGARLEGLLSASTSLTLRVPGAGDVALDLTATPSVDPRVLTPPSGEPSWAAWAAAGPGPAARRDAVDRLELAAAQSAQLRLISPYLTTGLPGPVRTSFRYSLAAPDAAAAAVSPHHVKPLALGIIGVAALLIAVDAELLRRRL